MDLIFKRKKANKIVNKLIKKYGKDIPIFLHYHKNKPYEFLFAVMMSAQCTDKRVNEVTKVLYKKYNTLRKIANAKRKDFEKDIHSVGFYHNKAKNIIATANILIDKYNGKIPKDIDELIELPGVGRKTANVVVGHLYNKPALAVDTHVMRVSSKLFSIKNNKDPKYIEKELVKFVNQKYFVLWNTHIISLGRDTCGARVTKCDECILKDLCDYKNA